MAAPPAMAPAAWSALATVRAMQHAVCVIARRRGMAPPASAMAVALADAGPTVRAFPSTLLPSLALSPLALAAWPVPSALVPVPVWGPVCRTRVRAMLAGEARTAVCATVTVAVTTQAGATTGRACAIPVPRSMAAARALPHHARSRWHARSSAWVAARSCVHRMATVAAGPQAALPARRTALLGACVSVLLGEASTVR